LFFESLGLSAGQFNKCIASALQEALLLTGEDNELAGLILGQRVLPMKTYEKV